MSAEAGLDSVRVVRELLIASLPATQSKYQHGFPRGKPRTGLQRDLYMWHAIIGCAYGFKYALAGEHFLSPRSRGRPTLATRWGPPYRIAVLGVVRIARPPGRAPAESRRRKGTVAA
jgi:hypothetical protein